MIKVVDLIQEIRSGYANSIDSTTLTKDRLIGYINTSIVELSKSGFVNFKDVIDVSITDDREYFLGNKVKKVRGVYKLDSVTGLYKSVLFARSYSDVGVVIINEQRLWISNPTYGDKYRIEVDTTLDTVDSSSFMDTLLMIQNNEVTTIELANPLEIYKYTKVIDPTRQLIGLQTELQTDLSYYQAQTNSGLFQMFNELLNSTVAQLPDSADMKGYRIKSVTTIGYTGLTIPSWLTEIAFIGSALDTVVLNNGCTGSVSGGAVTYNGVGSKQVVVEWVEIDRDKYKSTYDWSIITEHTLDYVQTTYDNLLISETKTSATITEMSVLLEVANYRNLLKQELDYLKTQEDLQQVQVTLGATRNYIDLPEAYKEFIILFASNKVMLGFNSNQGEFQSIYFQAAMKELERLEQQGYKDYVKDRVVNEIVEKGYI